jgi:hypothetical protein
MIEIKTLRTKLSLAFLGLVPIHGPFTLAKKVRQGDGSCSDHMHSSIRTVAREAGPSEEGSSLSYHTVVGMVWGMEISLRTRKYKGDPWEMRT